MQSKMLLAVLATLLSMTVLFTLAVPRPGARERPGVDPGQPAQTPAAPGSPGTAAPDAVGTAPTPAPAPQPVSELEAGLWCPTSFGFCLPAPEGWVASRRRSRAYLHRDPARPLQGNFSVVTLPNLFGRSLEELLGENRAELEQNPQFELHAIEIVELAGARRIRTDYTGTPHGGTPVRFAGLLWLAGPQQIALTFSVEAGQWADLAPEVERCLAGLGAGPRPTAR